MAQRVQVIRISDLSGEDLGDGGQTVKFGLGNDQYEMDLSEKEAEKFYDAFKKYTDVATKTAGRGVRKSRSTSSSDVDPKAVRAWCASNGIEVNDRGRIPADVIEKFKAAGN